MNHRPRVLITCIQLQRTLDDHRALLDARGIEIIVPAVSGQRLSEQEMLALIPSVDGMIAGDDEITAQVIEHADRLRIISKWGVGIDNIDLRAATERRVKVTNTPGMFGDEVADVVIGYLILLVRRLHVIDQGVRRGEWPKPEGQSIAGKTMGIIGLGDIGCEVARRAITMRMRVIGADIRDDNAAEAAHAGVEIAGKPEVLRQSDVLSLNCPLTPNTHHMIDGHALGAMKRGALLINTARGPLIDETALIDALKHGHIAGAALDVFEDEPLAADSGLRSHDNVILGSHNSSNTSEAVHRTSTRAIENLLEGLGVT